MSKRGRSIVINRKLSKLRANTTKNFQMEKPNIYTMRLINRNEDLIFSCRTYKIFTNDAVEKRKQNCVNNDGYMEQDYNVSLSVVVTKISDIKDSKNKPLCDTKINLVTYKAAFYLLLASHHMLWLANFLCVIRFCPKCSVSNYLKYFCYSW